MCFPITNEFEDIAGSFGQSIQTMLLDSFEKDVHVRKFFRLGQHTPLVVV
jgi:hypothetical protein